MGSQLWSIAFLRPVRSKKDDDIQHDQPDGDDGKPSRGHLVVLERYKHRFPEFRCGATILPTHVNTAERIRAEASNFGNAGELGRESCYHDDLPDNV